MVIRRVVSWSASAALVIAVCFVGFAGCGGSSVRSEGAGDDAADDGDDAGDDGDNAGDDDGSGVGGTSVGGTSAGGTGVGGMGIGGMGPGAAGVGAAPQSCARPLPDDATVGCNWRAALGGPMQAPSGYCAKSGCHNATQQAGGLDLTPDEFLAARLLDVPAKHDIDCAGGIACDAAAATCDKCSTCVLGEVLVSTDAPGTGRMFDTMAPFVPGMTTTTFSNRLRRRHADLQHDPARAPTLRDTRNASSNSSRCSREHQAPGPVRRNSDVIALDLRHARHRRRLGR